MDRFEIVDSNSSVHLIERCSCGASIEAVDGGWQETGRNAHPLGIDWLEEWRRTHNCPIRQTAKTTEVK